MNICLRRATVRVAIWVSLLTGACAGARHSDPTPRPEGERRCLLLTTNDSEAELDGQRTSLTAPITYAGTLSRIAGEKARLLAARSGAVLLVSAGDMLQGRYLAPADGDRRGAARKVWQIYEQAGFDLATLGNHDFDGGPEVLRHALQGLRRWRFVVSNLDPTSPTLNNSDGKLFSELEVRDCGGLKIGFLGLLTPSTRTISKFGDTRFKDANDPIHPAARAAVTELRRRGVHAVVALSHLGFPVDQQLARAVPGIDAIVGGHTHTYRKTWHRIGKTVIVQAGDRFKHLGHLELVADAAGGLDLKRSSWRMVPVNEEMAPDTQVAAAVDALRASYPAEVVIGRRSVGWALSGAERSVYGGRVAREMMRLSAALNRPVHGAMLNMGGLRTSRWYRPGPVTNFEIKAIHPFANRVVQVELTGAALREVAEHACSRSHRGDGLRVALFGLHIACDSSKPAMRYRVVEGVTSGIQTPGQRAMELRIGGAPVVADKTYRLAVNDYLARGGSGFWSLTQATRRCMDGAAWVGEGCKAGSTIAELVEAAVRAGRFDDPPAQR